MDGVAAPNCQGGIMSLYTMEAKWTIYGAQGFSKAAVPNLFWHQGPVSWKTIFPWMGEGVGSGSNASDGGDGSGGSASNGE